MCPAIIRKGAWRVLGITLMRFHPIEVTDSSNDGWQIQAKNGIV